MATRPAADSDGTLSRRLVVDVGRTRCRVAMFDGPRRVAFVERAAGRTASDADGLSVLLPQLRAVIAEVRPEHVDAVCAGIAGFAQGSTTARPIAATLQEATGAERVIVTSDMVCCHAGALGNRPGVVVAAGTGCVALAVDGGGQYARVDGWGYLVGDAGSGFTVGRAGLIAALRAADGRGGSPALLELVERRYGPRGRLVEAIYGSDSPPRTVAAFAPDVAEAARAGDAIAVEIWAGAARELAETVAAATGRVFETASAATISYTGKMFDLDDLVVEPFRVHLARRLPGARPVAPQGGAIEGARLLAAHAGASDRDLYGDLVYRLGTDHGARSIITEDSGGGPGDPNTAREPT